MGLTDSRSSFKGTAMIKSPDTLGQISENSSVISDKNVLLSFAARESDDWFLNICENEGKPVDILRLPGSYSVAWPRQHACTLWTPGCSLKGKYLRDTNGCYGLRKQN